MRTWVLGGVAVALVTVACGKDPSPTPPVTPPAKRAAPAKVKITLVEKGAEPRTPLRYRLKAPAKDVYEIVNTQKNRTGDVAHLTVQTTTMTADWDLSAVEAGGDARARMTMRDMKTDIPGQRDVGAALVGVRMHLGGRLTPLGGWTDVEMGIDEDPSGQMKAAMEPMMASLSQTMGQITAQFPSEAVGVGAKWTADVSITMLGMTIATTTTVTVVSKSGDVVVLAQTARGGAKNQTLNMAGLEGEVLDIAVDGNSTMTLNLTRAVPDAMQMTTNSTAKMRVRGPDGTPRDMDVISIQEMKVTRKG